jgi:hypothetical protein
MYNLNKNNYNKKPKASNIQTPKEVSQFIFELLRDKVSLGLILDPCSGQGNLLKPWKKLQDKGYLYTLGFDIDKDLNEPDVYTDFLNLTWGDYERYLLSRLAGHPPIILVLYNPPFNGYKNQLGSEVWLDKIIELFGKEVPIVLFAPVGFCANLTLKSKRHEKFENGTYPPIASRITLPKNIFPEVVFHSEILIFNIKGLQSHYFFKPYEK